MIPLPGDMGQEFLKGFAAGPKRFKPSEHKCPECESKLYYSENGVIHQDPPRKKVVCKKCHYKGFVPHVLRGNSLDITNSCTIRRSDAKKSD